MSEPVLSEGERRALLAMWCQVAWADGVIYEDERERMLELFERISRGAVARAELERWLAHGVSHEPGPIGEEARRLFVAEALALARSDGEFAPLELKAIRRLAGDDLDLETPEDLGY